MQSYPAPAPEPYKAGSSPTSSEPWVKRVFRWDRLDSTNEAAFRALKQGFGQDGDAFVSLEQTQGRGRRGSRWRSEPGQGLYVSFIIKPSSTFPGPMVTMLAGLACRDAVHGLGPVDARLKWPNDLLVGASKLAGILVESRDWSPERPVYVLGIGINVGQLAFPLELRDERPVVSLAQLGLAVTLTDMEKTLFASLDQRLQQARLEPRTLARDFLMALGFATSPVEIQVGAHSWVGQILSLEFGRGLELSITGAQPRWIPLEHIRSVTPLEPGRG